MTTNLRTHSTKFNKTNSRNKIFIGGLASDINKGKFLFDISIEDLIDYFKQYSQIADCVVLMDKITNHSRGFGFITIEDTSKVDTILNSQPHVIKGKRVECKKAIPKEVIQTQNDLFTEEVIRRKQNNDMQFYSRKLFIGGLPLTLTEEEMIRYFSQYGEVESCLIKKEEETGKSRGFGFILFVHPESIRNVLAYGNNHFILGKWIECKQAHPKEFQESQSNNGNNANINCNTDANVSSNNSNNSNANSNNMYPHYQSSFITQQNNLLNLYRNTNALANKCSNAIKQNVNMNIHHNNNNTTTTTTFNTNTTLNQQEIGQNDTNTLYNNKPYSVLDNQPTFNNQMKLFKFQNHITNSQFSSLTRNSEENDHNININNIYQRQEQPNQQQIQFQSHQRQTFNRQPQQPLNSLEDCLDARSNNTNTNSNNNNNINNITTITTLNENNSNKAIEDKEALIAYNRTNSNNSNTNNSIINTFNSNQSPNRPTLNNIRDIDTISNYFNCMKNPECTCYINYKLFDTSGQEVSKLAYKNSGRVQLFFEENNTISKDSDKDVLFKGKSLSNTISNEPNHLILSDHNHWKQTRNFRLKTDKNNFDNSNGQYKPY